LCLQTAITSAQDGDLPRPSDGDGNGGGASGLLPGEGETDPSITILNSPSRATEFDVDPAFRAYVDPGALSEAITRQSPSLLTDIGFQLAVGERALLRPHKIGSSQTILEWATIVASNAGDSKTLERIAQFAETNGNVELTQKAIQAKKLTTTSRAVKYSLPHVEPKDDNDRRYLDAIKDGLDSAIEAGDRLEAQGTAEFIRAAQMLPREINDQLATVAEQVARELPEPIAVPKELVDSVAKLVQTSRSVSRGPVNERGQFRVGDESFRLAAEVVENIDFERDQLSEAASQLGRRAEANNQTHVWDDQWYYTTLPERKFWLMVGYHTRSNGGKFRHFVAIRNTPSRWVVMNHDGKCYYPKNQEQVKLTWWPNGERVDFDIYNPEGSSWTANDIWYGFGR
jgi:hypothetical protein